MKKTIAWRIFYFRCWLTVQNLHISCWFWNLRGLKTCEEHSFYAQSWIDGKCRECDLLC